MRAIEKVDGNFSLKKRTRSTFSASRIVTSEGRSHARPVSRAAWRTRGTGPHLFGANQPYALKPMKVEYVLLLILV
jgi:hypothetical protein